MNLYILLLTLCAISKSEIFNLTKFTTEHLEGFVEKESKNDADCSGESNSDDTGLLGLIKFIAANYMRDCVNVVLYDRRFEEESSKLNFNLKDLLVHFPGDYVNGQIAPDITINDDFLRPQKNKCTHYLLFTPDLSWATKVVGAQTVSKVIVVTLSTRWQIEEYLQKAESRKIVNLLIVSHVSKQDIFFGLEERSKLSQYTNLYTHNLLTDPIGSSTVRFLTSWRCGKLSRNLNLFPVKLNRGFNGKQFSISASEQPPFTFRKRITLDEDSDDSQLWDGVEIRLLRLLGDFLNYTMEIRQPKTSINQRKGPSEIVIEDIVAGLAEIGSAGVYVTNQRLSEIWLSAQHTTDCAAFITKATTSLPRYRAILGPFQLSVWITLTITYLIAIVPLTFADSHSLKPLIKNPWLIEDMFWHVFGTFTNLFTFTEKKSWTKSKKYATRLLVGWYWAFSIIVTACYTGSIVSFITLFVFPDVIDHVDQLVKMNFRVGSLSTAGWDTWFNDSDHEQTKWLLRDVELVPNTTQGLKNVSNSFYLPMFRPYAFLAGRAQMEYIVQANYTTSKRKEKLHISKDCFVPFGVSFVFPNNAIYADKFSEYILRIQQSGLMGKLLNEFKWEIERSSSGKLLQASSGKPLKEIVPIQRKLTLDDTQGIFLLLGAGFLIATSALIAELVESCKKRKKSKKLWLFSLKMHTMSIKSLSGFQKEMSCEISDYDETAYKKYDSRILESKYSNNTNANAVLQKSSKNSRNRTDSLFGERYFCSNTSLPESEFDNVTIPHNKINKIKIEKTSFNSSASLPWEFSSHLHYRQKCESDQKRVRTT